MKLLARIRHWRQRRQCKKHGHFEACTLSVFTDSGMQHHVHECIACGEVTKNVVEPIESGVRTFLSDLDLLIEDQRATYIH